MQSVELYKTRIENFTLLADNLQKRENRLSIARLISFLTGLVLFFTLLSTSVAWAVVAFVICMTAFGRLVKYHARIEKLREFYRHLERINRLELQCLSGSYFEYADGSAYEDKDHPNSHDLDLFGHASIFQYSNRTVTKPAADMLASLLKAPAPADEIVLRQEAVLELKPQIEWRQKLVTVGYVNSNASNDPQELVEWANSKNLFTRRQHLKIVTYCLSIICIVATVMVFFGMPPALLIPVLVINFMFYFGQAKKIAALHAKTGKSSDILGAYAETIRLIENENFGSARLKELHRVFTGKHPVSEYISQLARLVARLDTRLNIMVSIPLNLFFFWDIHCCLALEKWKNSHASEISKWFDAMAEFEVLSSFANMAFNNPGWVMPETTTGYFTLKAENAGHPLIQSERRIGNNIEISGTGKTVIVTGSNMSGKSTFLRTIGVNTVLALAGAPVCATAFRISPVRVFSAMRISDSLEDNTSSFYAELKRLAAIINTAERDQKVLLLLDEILRGTNSNDRYTGSVALVKQLIGYGAVSVIATHDLRLAGLENELPGKIDNYHFDVKINGEELYFDYKLTQGICTSMNASLLMKKMGIKIISP